MPEIFIHPDRKTPRIRPLKAWRHMRHLIADKEDTEQVFHIIDALNGGAVMRNFMRFMSSDLGPGLLKRREHLPPILDDHAWLKALPAGTVGRAYVEFMEQEGLTAQGLVDESERFGETMPQFDDDLNWYAERQRDTHDLYHVLTGYGRDALGEAALLGFTYGQNPTRGILFIAYIASRHMARHLPKATRVMDCLWEGKRLGQAAQNIVRQDVVALLNQPLADVRRQLNIQPPVTYQAALQVCREERLEVSKIQVAA